jgi:hypothetical protein
LTCVGCRGRIHLLGIWSLVGLDGRRDSVVIVEAGWMTYLRKS